MSVVTRDGSVAFKKGSLDHQHIGVADVLKDAFGGFGIAHDDELLGAG